MSKLVFCAAAAALLLAAALPAALAVPIPEYADVIRSARPVNIYITLDHADKVDAFYLQEIYICDHYYPFGLVAPHTTYNRDYGEAIRPYEYPPKGWPVVDARTGQKRVFQPGLEVVTCIERVFEVSPGKWKEGDVFVGGPGSRNLDGAVHMKIVDKDPNPVNGAYRWIKVAFEDRRMNEPDRPEDPSAEKDFNDAIFTIWAYDGDNIVPGFTTSVATIN